MLKRKLVLILSCLLILMLGAAACGNKQKGAIYNKTKVSSPRNSEEVEDISISNTTDNQSLTEEDLEYQEFMNSVGQDEVSDRDNADDSSDVSKDYGNPDQYGRVGYHYDIDADKKDYDGDIDIIVGDNLYSTQINDWYANFDLYKDKVVKIEGYYIDDYAPYTFIGRYGPSCPYCNGGYVSFEFYTLDDLSQLKSGEDWISVTGILREGEDDNGTFYYIEVLSWEKMNRVGKDTVTN